MDVLGRVTIFTEIFLPLHTGTGLLLCLLEGGGGGNAALNRTGPGVGATLSTGGCQAELTGVHVGRPNRRILPGTRLALGVDALFVLILLP